MRSGFNPNKDQLVPPSKYLHQVVVPVHIPHQTDYFKDSLSILQFCLDSLTATVQPFTLITVVNNGSCEAVVQELNRRHHEGTIHEIIHTTAIGKVNALLKGLVGQQTPLVTLTDADVLFQPGWQEETIDLFEKVARIGAVGLIPQMNLFRIDGFSLVWEHLFSSRLRFAKIPDVAAAERFYHSIGWDRNYNPNHVLYNLQYTENGKSMWVGSGHVVTTFRRDVFREIQQSVPHQLGGDSEWYLEEKPYQFHYHKVTTASNYAFHMGNVSESWMEVPSTMPKTSTRTHIALSPSAPKINRVAYYWRYRFWRRIMMNTPLLFRWCILRKGLPKSVIDSW